MRPGVNKQWFAIEMVGIILILLFLLILTVVHLPLKAWIMIVQVFIASVFGLFVFAGIVTLCDTLYKWVLEKIC